MDHAIEPASGADDDAIDRVHRACFPGPVEAAIVAALRRAGDLSISLVARAAPSGDVIGHVAFSPAAPGRGLGVGPVAVLEPHRRGGVAASLIDAGLDLARTRGVDWVMVLGDPAYYARFGFAPASRFGLACIFGGGDAFQILALRDPPQLPPPGTTLRYAPAFDRLSRP